LGGGAWQPKIYFGFFVVGDSLECGNRGSGAGAAGGGI